MPPEVLQTLPGYGPDVAENRAEARGIMNKLGYGPDKPLAVTVTTRNAAAYRDAAVLLIGQLQEIFIDGTLNAIDTKRGGEKLFGEASRLLQTSVIRVPLWESTPSELQRVFAEIPRDRPDAIIVSPVGDLGAHGRLIVELIEKSRLPAMYPYRAYVEAGGLMAYASDNRELWRRMAADVHEILRGAKPGDIPIYQPAKFEYIVNLKTANALGLTVPPSILARADEVIE